VLRGGRRLRVLLSVLLILSSMYLLAQPASAESKLSETRRKLRATRAKLAAIRQDDAALLAVIRQLGGQLSTVRVHLRNAEAVLARIEANIRGQERRLAALEAERQERAAVVRDRARTLYIMGPSIEAEALLGSRSIGEFIERTESLDQAMRSDRVLMDDLARISDQAAKAKAALSRERTKAAAIRQGVAERAAELGEILSVKQEAESSLGSQIGAYQREVAALEREQARILAIIRSKQTHSTGPISKKGFIWPFRGPITSDYGPRWGGFHTGIDINCETGDRIVAAKAGKVIAAEWGGGYGRMIIIDHGNGVSTLYAHNSALYVSEGRTVARGTRISACGETGNATGDHLHFEVRINGNHTDPKPFLP
jgi:murein DD-endopeptidase MepM/ murein hydrolase activator NlpD